MSEQNEKTCDHEQKLEEFRTEIERESTFPHWSGDQLYIFKLIKKWFDAKFRR